MKGSDLRVMWILGLACAAACGNDPAPHGNAGERSVVRIADPNDVPHVPTASGPFGAATVQGTAAGVTLTPTSAIFATTVIEGTPILLLEISDQQDMCAQLGRNARRSGTTTLVFELVKNGADGALPIDAGDYTLLADTTGAVDVGDFAAGAFEHLDVKCNNTIADAETRVGAGSLHLTALGASDAQGVFGVEVGETQSPLFGGFWALPCAALISRANSTTVPACE